MDAIASDGGSYRLTLPSISKLTFVLVILAQDVHSETATPTCLLLAYIETFAAELPSNDSDLLPPVAATKEQCYICKSLYDEHRSRYAELSNRANLYITILAVLGGVALFRFTDFATPPLALRIRPLWEFFAAFAYFTTFGICVLNLIVRRWHPTEDVEALYAEIIAGTKVEIFYARRIQAMAKATENTIKYNERVSNLLR